MREYLRKIRKRAGFTQTQAATKLRISQNHLSNIEKGVRQSEIKLRTLMCMAECYDVPLNSLIAAETEYQNEVKGGLKNDGNSQTMGSVSSCESVAPGRSAERVVGD